MSKDFLDRWTMNETGQIGCYDNALERQYHAQTVIDAVEAHNALILRARDARADYKQALRVTEPDAEVPTTIDVLDAEGNVINTIPQQDWLAWNDAQAVIANVSPDILAWIDAEAPEPETETPEHDAWMAVVTARDAAYRQAPLVPDPALAEAKGRALLAVLAFADEMGTQLLAGYPAAERASWDAKLAEARAIVAGEIDPLKFPVVAAEIGVTGANATDVAAIVLAKAGMFQQAAGLISGLRQATIAGVDAAQTLGEIAAVLDGAKAQAEAAMAGLV
jgi:hypothetical protein